MFILHVQPPSNFKFKFQNSMCLGYIMGKEIIILFLAWLYMLFLIVCWFSGHYRDVIMRAMASQINSLTIVYSTVNSGADQRKHQSPASLALVRGIHQWPANSPYKWLVTRKMFPFDDVIMVDIPKTHRTQTSAIVSWRSSNVTVVLFLKPLLRWDNQGIQYACIKWCLDDFVHCTIRASLVIVFQVHSCKPRLNLWDTHTQYPVLMVCLTLNM